MNEDDAKRSAMAPHEATETQPVTPPEGERKPSGRRRKADARKRAEERFSLIKTRMVMRLYGVSNSRAAAMIAEHEATRRAVDRPEEPKEEGEPRRRRRRDEEPFHVPEDELDDFFPY